jgi:glycerophosphoryl diester phosphodiesterase
VTDLMHALLDIDVDGIVTDRADLLRDVLIARGQWGQG